jgi:exopolyphosphatase/guanosine-5'-triphosphate,3'-diphosphate pyrophosphatase
MAELEWEQLDRLVESMCHKFQYEPLHCGRVAVFARQLFDALAPLHELGEAEAHLLRHAALLHDVGHFIGFQGHHKHGEYLVRHDAALAGYPQAERELLAYVVRCHRKKAVAPPAGLSCKRQQQALVLAALLRLADGIDYDRNDGVRLLRVEATRKEIRLFVAGINPEGIDQVLADKAALMKRAFGRKVVWLAAGDAAPA